MVPYLLPILYNHVSSNSVIRQKPQYKVHANQLKICIYFIRLLVQFTESEGEAKRGVGGGLGDVPGREQGELGVRAELVFKRRGQITRAGQLALEHGLLVECNLAADGDTLNKTKQTKNTQPERGENASGIDGRLGAQPRAHDTHLAAILEVVVALHSNVDVLVKDVVQAQRHLVGLVRPASFDIDINQLCFRKKEHKNHVK